MIRNSKNPKKAPTLTPIAKSMTQILDELKKELESVEIAERINITKISFPSIEYLGSIENETRRSSISEMYEYILAYNGDYKEYLLLKTNLKEWEEDVITTRNAFKALSKSYLDHTDMVGLDLTPISLYIGSLGLDFMKNIVPRLTQINNVISDKQKNTDKLLKNESKKLNKMVNSGLQFIEGEQQFYTNQISSNDSNNMVLKNKIKFSIDSFDKISIEYLAQSKLEKEKLQVQLKASLDPLNLLLADQKKLQDSYNKDKAAYKKYQYTGCPKKLSYDSCTSHPAEKKAYMDNKTEWKGRLDEKLKKINSKTDEVNKASTNYKKTQKFVNAEIAKINKATAEMVNAHTNKIKSIQNAINVLDSQKNKLNKLLNESNADYTLTELLKVTDK
jgi:hypothetical protein